MNNMSKCYKKYNKSQQRELKKYWTLFYQQLLTGETEIKNLSVNTISTSKEITSLVTNYWVPVHIKEHIQSRIKKTYTFTTVINDRKIELSFHVFNNVPDEEINRKRDAVFLLLYLLTKYSPQGCSQYLTINIFLTAFKKKLPNRKSDIIGTDNVNSGFSHFGCKNKSEVVIYREEEWFKVLIHELFHNLNLDFSTANISKSVKKLKSYCKLDSDYYIFETYCETWGRILNVCIKSFLETTSEKTLRKRKANYLDYVNESIELERIQSLKQGGIIISRIGNVEDYKEASNVLCYYVFTAALMNDYLSFLQWCKKINKIDEIDNIIRFNNKPDNIESFTQLIIEKLDSNEFSKAIACVMELNLGNSKSLRMSII